MRLHEIELDPSRIATFCRRHGIVCLSVFGSALRSDFGSTSNVDILVEFAPGETPSLLELGGMQVELSALCSCTVDLKTPGFLSPRILRQVLAERVVQYAA